MKSTYLVGAIGVWAVLSIAAYDPAAVGPQEPAPPAVSANPSDARKPSLAPSFDLERAAGYVNSLVGFPLLNVHSPDPHIRSGALKSSPEDLRQIELEWKRVWFTDPPSHLTPAMVDANIQ